MSSFRRWLTVLCVLVLAPFFAVAPTLAAEVVIVNLDPPGMGLNDPTPLSPVEGNPGTTLGQQRLNVFEAAASRWGDELLSDVPILVEATMVDLFCDANSALLGQAGPVNAIRDFPGAPAPGTWYAVALANALARQDFDSSSSDVFAQFNSALDTDPGCLGGAGWYYGIDSSTPSGMIGFFPTVLHEMAHGLGFSSFVDETTGEKLLSFDDAFSNQLMDETTGKKWSEMSNAQRKASAINTGNLVWSGGRATAASSVLNDGVHPSGRIQMYAPSPVEPGSSVSHWDVEVSPDELMEPFLVNTAQNQVTSSLLEDIGYDTVSEVTQCNEDSDTICLGTGDRFQVEVTWEDFQGNRGVAQGAPISTSSGLLYFFNPNNLEMLIKVLDGCTINDRWWVFFAATTNVQFRVEVTDTDTGLRRSYFNPLGQSADAITDTSAFETCGGRRSGNQVTDIDERALERRVSSETSDMLASLKRSNVAAVELRGPNGDVRTVMPIQASAVADLGGGAVQVELASSAATRDRSRIDQSSENVGPFGSTYSIVPLLAHPTATGFNLFTIQEPGSNVVTFDGLNESLPKYGSGLGTVPRVKETATLRSDNTTLDIEVTILSKDGDDLFPGGFLGNGVPLTDGAIAIGTFQGSDPLDFPHKKMTKATMEVFGGGKKLGTVNFNTGQLTGPWSGDISLVLEDSAGLGIGAIVFKATFELDGTSNPTDPDDPGMDGTPVTPFTCVESATKLCLNNGRFEVKVNWRDFVGKTGTGTAVPIDGSTDSGLFWFFNENNIEELFKVLNGCSLNERYWVFFAATTNVEFDVTVTDSQTGKVRLYSNELGMPANAVTDTSAFATCP